MSASRIDRIVKGTPPPDASKPAPAPLEHAPLVTSSPDPLSTLPSAPPQIYLNLLILETSLRSQYLTLRARRRQNTFFLLILAIWIAYFSYALFLRPREDGRGVGGSVYWVVEMGEKVALMGGVVTGILTWGTGQWDRGVRWPRRWLAVANRGLRGMNTKIVLIRGPWWKETISYFSFIFPYSSFFQPAGSSFRFIEHSFDKRGGSAASHRLNSDSDSELGVEEDLAPGGDYIKLLLLPKSFSPEFRENWDEYRSDYWDKENKRRARLRQKLKQRDRQIAKAEGGWLWWTGWRGWKRIKKTPTASRDLEKPHHSSHHHQHNHSLSHHGRHHPESKSRRLTNVARSDSPSGASSRSTTPTTVEGDERSSPERTSRRRGSATSERKRRRSKHSTSSPARGRGLSPLTSTSQSMTYDGTSLPTS